MLTNFNEFINEGIFGDKHDKIVGELINMIKKESHNLSVNSYLSSGNKIDYFKGFINDLKINIYSYRKDGLYDRLIYGLELDGVKVHCSQNKLRKLVKTIAKIINNENKNDNDNDNIIEDIYNKKISKIGRTANDYNL